MPRTRSKNEKIDTEIYVILSPDNTEFYVGKTKKPNHYQAYKDHVRLKNAQTKNLFSRSIENGLAPKMYLLETINATKTEAYSHCVVWTKFFLHNYFSPIAAQTTIDYANDLNDENLKLYLQIKDIPIEKIINNETLLVSNYESRKQEKKKDHIGVCVTPEEYDFIQTRAEKEGLTVSKYCKELIVKDKIIRIDLSDYLREMRDIKKILYEIQFAILQNGRYYPADLENLQKLVNRLDDGQKKVVRAVASQSKKLKKQKRTNIKSDEN